ncbi:hypothetical protein ACIRBY_03875 [Streptomyces sp. NPDC096136]|uniref:hypothetical protein n=1 Tax=Streptomyces sp. NPDC096136 TaxID=3366076 RepID=UPI003808DBE1
MPTIDELVAIKDREKAGLLAIPGVVMVGIGCKEVGDELTSQPAIKLLVDRKRPESELAPHELIPARIDGAVTDVVAIGTTVPLGRELPTRAASAAGPELPGAAIDPDAMPFFMNTGHHLMGGYGIGMFRPAGRSESESVPDGTLACVVKDKVNPWKHYALTCQHVALVQGSAVPEKGVTKCGQPIGTKGDLGSCPDDFGKWETGAFKVTVKDHRQLQLRDEALILIDPGRTWSPSIAGLGEITGVRALSVAEAATGDYPVRKFGARTRKTGGLVTGVFDDPEGSNEEVLTIRVDPARVTPEQYPHAFFAWKSDSGALVVSDTGAVESDNRPVMEVIGVVFQAGAAATAKAGPGVHNITYAWPIHKLLKRFKDDGYDLEVATIHNSAIVNTVPEPPTPAGRPRTAGADSPLTARLRADLEELPAGRLLMALWDEHRGELTDLVHHQRRATVLWHRGQGPVLMQWLARVPDEPGLALPRELAGLPLDERIDLLHRGLREHAGPALRAALDRAHTALPALAGLTYPQLLDAVRRA